MVMLHAYKVEQSEVLNIKIILRLVDEHFTHATNGAALEKPDEFSGFMPRFG